MAGDILVVDPATAEPSEPVTGLVERTAFHVDGYRFVALRVESASPVHKRSGALFGWVRGGAGRIGDGDGQQIAIEMGKFLHVPAGVGHRFAAGSEPLELLVVVTDGPDVTSVTAPTQSWKETGPTVVGPEDLHPTVESPDLVRETPFPDREVLLMRVRAGKGAAAGWHHHGDNVYFGYAVDGPSETEYGPQGERSAWIEIGECFHVPPRLIHRDTNPTDTAHTGIIWLCGGEPWVHNVDGPG